MCSENKSLEINSDNIVEHTDKSADLQANKDSTNEEGKEENNPNKSSKKQRRVSFSSVKIREYDRLYDGGGGIPDTGGFPLGLGWLYDEQDTLPLDLFEETRTNSRHSGALGSSQKKTWQKRKEILESADAETNELVPPIKQRKVDSDLLKTYRKRTGCNCKKKKKTCTKGCECVENEISCHVYGCGCSEGDCGNPLLCHSFI